MYYYTTETRFALRTISLMDGDMLIFRAIPIEGKLANYVPTQEKAVDHCISLMGAKRSHALVYSKHYNGFLEAIYRRQ